MARSWREKASAAAAEFKDKASNMALPSGSTVGLLKDRASVIAADIQDKAAGYSSSAQKSRTALKEKTFAAASEVRQRAHGTISSLSAVEYAPLALSILGSLDLRDLSLHSTEDLGSYSILGNVSQQKKKELVRAGQRFAFLDRAMGAMCGMAIGDAMGHMFEFLPATDAMSSHHFDVLTMTFHEPKNAFKLEHGQWTDDASMGLCIADSLIAKRGFDGSDMRVRFWCWWHCAYNNAFRFDPSRTKSVGLGGNVSKSLKALSALQRGEQPPPAFDGGGQDAGNGSLMRLAPLAIYFHRAQPSELYTMARQSSYTTHPGVVAAEACSLLAHIIRHAVDRPEGPVDAKQFLEDATTEYLLLSDLASKSGVGYDEIKQLATGCPIRETERCWAWRESSLDILGSLRARGSTYHGYAVNPGYFGSYSLDGLAVALWAVYNTDSFDEALARSINVLGDADSHGSITCQIAGALYGYSSINGQFVTWLNRWDKHDFAVRGLLLYELGIQRCDGHVNGIDRLEQSAADGSKPNDD